MSPKQKVGGLPVWSVYGAVSLVVPNQWSLVPPYQAWGPGPVDKKSFPDDLVWSYKFSVSTILVVFPYNRPLNNDTPHKVFSVVRKHNHIPVIRAAENITQFSNQNVIAHAERWFHVGGANPECFDNKPPNDQRDENSNAESN